MECPIPPVVLNPQLVYTSHSAVGCAGPKVEQDPALMLRVKYQVRLEATGVEKKRDIGQFLLAKFPPFFEVRFCPRSGLSEECGGTGVVDFTDRKARQVRVCGNGDRARMRPPGVDLIIDKGMITGLNPPLDCLIRPSKTCAPPGVSLALCPSHLFRRLDSDPSSATCSS
jgi:hypothetical protein